MSDLSGLGEAVKTFGDAGVAVVLAFFYWRLRDIAEAGVATRILLARLLQTVGVTEEQAREDVATGTVPPATHRIQARTPPRPLPPVREFRRSTTRGDGDR